VNIKKYTIVFLCAVFLCAGNVHAEADTTLSVTGEVMQPLNLTLDDLHRFQTVQVQHCGVLADGTYKGFFTFGGVPLRTLLELAHIAKGDTGFQRPIDLVIMVTSRDGRRAALSWGEIMNSNPSSCIVALTTLPVTPKKKCTMCHKKGEYEAYQEQLDRSVGLPKLVVSGDRYADRCLENIISVQVLDLRPRMAAGKNKKAFSAQFTVSGAVTRELTIQDLAAYAPRTTRITYVGEGSGFHGFKQYGGASLKDIITDAGVAADPGTVMLVKAADGFRSAVSYGELFFSRSGGDILMADSCGGKPLEKFGAFSLVVPDDLITNRGVGAITGVEVVSPEKKGKIYAVGIGCGDTNLITLEAISTMAKADVFVCPPDIRKRFAAYMGGRPVLFNVYDFAPPVVRKKNHGGSTEAFQKGLHDERAERAVILEKALKQNKNIVVLDYGDPTFFSGWSWMRDFFSADTIQIIPGIGSFAVASTLLKDKIGLRRSVVLTTDKKLRENPDLLKAVAEKGETIGIYMALKHPEKIASLLKQFYPDQTPAHLVYKAGYAAGEKVITTTVGGLQQAAEQEEEKLLGLICLGDTKSGKCE